MQKLKKCPNDTIPLNDTAIPVIAGLAVGIAFVVLFSSSSSLLPVRNDSAFSVEPNTIPEEQIEGIDSDSVDLTSLPNYIDFSVSLPEADIILKKGETVKIPVLIESDRQTEKVLALSVMPYSDLSIMPYSEVIEGLALSLDKQTVVVSKDDITQELTPSRVIREVTLLTVSASPTIKAGTYEYFLEANYQHQKGAGQLFRVTVLD